VGYWFTDENGKLKINNLKMNKFEVIEISLSDMVFIL